MHLLFLSRWFPFPPDNGSKIRIYNLLRGLAQQHRVSLISFFDSHYGRPQIDTMLQVCQDVQVVPWKSYRPGSWRARLGYFNTVPRAYVDTYSSEMEQAIKDKLDSGGIDLVIASQIDTAIYAGAFAGTPAIFEELEIGVVYDGFSRAASLPARLRSGLTWSKYRHYLSRLLNNYYLCTVVSEREQMVVKREIHSKIPVEVIPNCVDLSAYQNVIAAPQPNRLVFCGSLTYRLNYEAVGWFLEKVFPLLRAQNPELQLVITGDHGGLPLPNLDGVLLTGIVKDVRPYIASSWLSIVPLQTGGGTRFKILESMALRTPVISTAKGAEGLALQSGVHALIADDPGEFSAAVLRVLHEPGMRELLAENAFELLCQRYNWKTVLPRYLHLVQQVAGTQDSVGYKRL